MKVDRIYINTHRYDLRFTRTCVASVRYWYPSIPVSLIVDHSSGPFPDREMLRTFNLDLFDNGNAKYGWGFGKFEPLFVNLNHSFLVLDADTVLSGDVLSKVKDIEAEFIVDLEETAAEKRDLLYYSVNSVRQLFPEFVFPGYMFNTGQWFGTSGIIGKEDLSGLVEFDTDGGPRLVHPAIFRQADQGIFNFILHRLAADQRLTVARVKLMIWPEDGAADFIKLESIMSGVDDYPYIVHWAGMKGVRNRDFPRGDIMEFYQREFQKKLSLTRRMFVNCFDVYLRLEKKYRSRVRRIKAIGL